MDKTDLEAEVEQEEINEISGEIEEKETEVKKEPEEKKEIVNVNQSIMVNDQNYLDSNTIEGRYRLANAYYQGGMIPKNFKNVGQVFAGLEFARELGLKPLSGLRNIAVINGSPSLWGDLPLALVRQSKGLEYITEFLFDKNYKKLSFANKNLDKDPWGSVCITKRRSDPEPVETWFTLDDAKRAGLLGRDNVWKTYPRRMLQMRSRSQNLKDNFSDSLMGIPISEYDFNYMPQQGDSYENKISRAGVVQRDIAKEINGTIEQDN